MIGDFAKQTSTRPGKRLKNLWENHHGKCTNSMVIVHSYLKLSEGNWGISQSMNGDSRSPDGNGQ
jgi:hypothetical protein